MSTCYNKHKGDKHLDKIIGKLMVMYPDIQWDIAEPNDDILTNFGNGIILIGHKNGQTKEFFILEEDKDRLKWGIVIANFLNQTVVHEKNPI